jgi:hypothetical protein
MSFVQKILRNMRLNKLKKELEGLKDGMLKANIEFEIYIIEESLKDGN